MKSEERVREDMHFVMTGNGQRDSVFFAIEELTLPVWKETFLIDWNLGIDVLDFLSLQMKINYSTTIGLEGEAFFLILNVGCDVDGAGAGAGARALILKVDGLDS